MGGGVRDTDIPIDSEPEKEREHARESKRGQVAACGEGREDTGVTDKGESMCKRETKGMCNGETTTQDCVKERQIVCAKERQ